MTNNRPQFSVIYDFETFSTDRTKAAIACVAGLRFDMDRFLSDNPYTFSGLLQNTQFMKFEVGRQVTDYHRTVSKDTLDWWREKPYQIQEQLIEPSKSNDRPIEQFVTFMKELIPNEDLVDNVFTRGNTFDPIIKDFLLEDLQSQPIYPYWKDRDTRSFIDGLTYGSDMKNSFLVPGLEEVFVVHDPRHDICMDVMRLQHVIRILNDLGVD